MNTRAAAKKLLGDVILSGAENLLFLMENKQKPILRGVYPEPAKQILRCAQDDSEGPSMTDSAFPQIAKTG